MSEGDDVSLIGLYASFPLRKDRRRVEILKTVLGLENELRFKQITLGSLQNKLTLVGD